MQEAAKHIQDILSKVVEYAPEQKAVVVYDQRCELTQVLTQAYRECLPEAELIDFDETSQESILEVFSKLNPSDLVVLIQSNSFRLEKFRIRVTLFNRSIKVIEHPHLERMSGDAILYYVDSLAYDPEYYRGIGHKLKSYIDQASEGVLKSGEETLVFSEGFEETKLNIGDYTGMKNIGGQFPIGEVFTENKDLEKVKGRVRIFAFGDTSFQVNQPEEPITLVIEKGCVVEALNSTPEFDRVLENIRSDEAGEVWVRELGLGMNRAFTRERVVPDIGTYERMCGVHLSLGAKHHVYKKTNFKFTPRDSKHHVDVFAETDAVLFDGQNVFSDRSWIV